MKKFFTILFVFSILFTFPYNSMAQCPGCIINVGCTASPAQPAICPDTLPDGTALVPYDEDISFYLPENFNDASTGYNVDLEQLDVLNIVGMPYGLSWQTSAHPSNIYYPTSNPPASEHGCAKICGTPLIPGNYTITVFVLAHVKVNSLGGITTTSNTSFDIPLTILPPASSNNGFTIGNPIGCAPLSTGFVNNRPSNGHAGYSYLWNFGNGNQSSTETPPVQIYSNPGNYPVSLLTTIDTLGYYFQALTVNASPDCNDSPWSDPDYYFKLKQGTTTLYTAPYIDNDAAPVTFSFTPIALSNLTYSLEIWDYDDGLAGADDHCATFTFNGHNAGTFTLQNGTTVITYNVNHPVLTFTDTDTIQVFSSPVVSPLTFTPNDTVCNGDSIMLGVTATNGNIYQWYADTSAILNAVDSIYYATSDGLYYVEVTNSNGCRTNSQPKALEFVDNPSKPGIWIIGNTLNTNATGVSLQWYHEGNLISGATASSYEIGVSGNYFLIASNWFGCTTSSDTIYCTYMGVSELNDQKDVMIMPNPGNGHFTISSDKIFTDQLNITVRDISGRIVFGETLHQLNGTLFKQIDISNSANGLYIVELNADKFNLVRKIIKQ